MEPVAFDCWPRTRMVYGAGALQRIGALAAELGGSRVLLVTDSGIVAAGHVEHAEESLREAGLWFHRFDDVHENPTTRDVDRCLAVAREQQVDLLIGLGGGSSLDTTKGCNFLFTNGGRMEDYWGVGKASKSMLPMIAVPTTAGTGSEMQSFALIAREEDHQKMACGDPKAAARVALLDPTLTLSQPRPITAQTGLDTLTHAVETAVTRKRNTISFLYSRESFRLAEQNFPRVLQNPQDLEARGAMLQAAAFAGFAIENSMLGAAHSLANPLTAHHGVPHGQAVGLMLPHVIRFNAAEPATSAHYQELLFGSQLSVPSGKSANEVLAERVEELLELAGLTAPLEHFGVSVSDLPGLAQGAAQQWTAQFNPRSIEANDFQRLYDAALR